MKNCTVAFVILFLALGMLPAQDLYWGVKGGLIGSRYLGGAYTLESEGCCSGYEVAATRLKPGFGAGIGAFFEYEIGTKGALRPELNLQFTGQHADFYYGEGSFSNGVLTDTSQSVNSLSYSRVAIEVPLLLKAKLGKKEGSYLVFGVFASQLLSESIKGEQVNTRIFPSTGATTEIETLNDDAILSEMIRGDGGIVLGYGLHFPVGDNAFEAELRMRQGFWNQFAGSDLKIRLINSAVFLNAAYVFDLNNGH